MILLYDTHFGTPADFAEVMKVTIKSHETEREQFSRIICDCY